MKQHLTKAQQPIIEQTKAYIQAKFEGESSGHDWWHIYRVWQNAIHISQKIGGANGFVVELGALLHDVADWKFHGGDLAAGARVAREWLQTCGVDGSTIEAVAHIVEHVSFKGAGEASTMQTLEGKIVQDADRLDAIGAIGIGRTFAYGGSRGRVMYDPAQDPTLHASFEQYKQSQGPTINHFYEKLFLLKDRLNTEVARDIAGERHKFMETFVARFLAEWQGTYLPKK